MRFKTCLAFTAGVVAATWGIKFLASGKADDLYAGAVASAKRFVGNTEIIKEKAKECMTEFDFTSGCCCCSSGVDANVMQAEETQEEK